MSATLTWTGTWTPLNFDPIGLPASGTNQPGARYPNTAGMVQDTTLPPSGALNQSVPDNVKMLFNFNGEVIKTNDLPELEQFIQAMAAGYAITYQAAVALLTVLFTAKSNRESARIGPGRNLLYAP
jgi:hypothetical protein